MDPASVLEQIELQIGNIKEEAFSRKEILEKVEKWLSACEEESWLEEYNRVGCCCHLFVLIHRVIILKSLPYLTPFFAVRMITVTMLEEVLILLSSVLRKLVLWLINFQVETALLEVAACIKLKFQLKMQM